MPANPDGPGDEPLPGYGLPLLYNTVYCSIASAGVGEKDVDGIIAAARRHNPRHGITGLLVFGGGIFFQWLEGPRERVTSLMTILRADPRHNTIVQLGETEEVRERLFPNWDMERVTKSEIRDVLEDALDNCEEDGNARSLRQLIEQLDGGRLKALVQG